MTENKFNDPLHFAIPHNMPTADRAQVPQRIAREFGFTGRIEFVRADGRMRLYKRYRSAA